MVLGYHLPVATWSCRSRRATHCRARVYDRANAPDEVWEISSSQPVGDCDSGCRQFKSESDLDVGDVREPITSGQGGPYWPVAGGDAREGVLALTPDGQLRLLIMNGYLRFWDPATHKQVREDLPSARHSCSQQNLPSMPMAPWRQSATLYSAGPSWWTPKPGWSCKTSAKDPGGNLLSFPRFSPDGRHLLLQLRPAESRRCRIRATDL